MRAQVSIEYLLITGFSLLLLAPLLVLYASQQVTIQEQYAVSQAQQVSEQVLAAAQLVHFAGPGSTRNIRVRIPQGVNKIQITPIAIQFDFSQPTPQTIRTRSEIPLINTTINPSPGIAFLSVESTSLGVIVRR